MEFEDFKKYVFREREEGGSGNISICYNQEDGFRNATITKNGQSLCSSTPGDFLILARAFRETEQALFEVEESYRKKILECRILGKMVDKFEKECGEWDEPDRADAFQG